MNPADAPLDENDPDLPEIEFHSPGRFAIHNPCNFISEQHSRLEPAPFHLGQHSTLERFSKPAQAQAHTLALLQQARHSLCLYSYDLEPWLYNHSSVQEACAQLLLANPRNRVRILLRDVDRPLRQGHRLLNLGKRITSNLHIRRVNTDYPYDESGYLLADACGLLLRDRAEQPHGYALYNDSVRTRQRQTAFDQAWEQSLSDPDLRSFLL